MVFHEITRDAIARALDETREIDQRLVDAQETRRILDRLYGYEVSPVLWKKVTRGLSAGRVQSVATRLVVDRERERIAFVAAGYWDLLGTFDPGDVRGPARRRRRPTGRAGQGLRSERRAPRRNPRPLDEARARKLASDLVGASFTVRSSDEKPYRRKPAAPFRTATLQQEASRKLRFSAQTTMRVAQRLYESGYITYMRTDSTTLSESALDAARAQVRALFGDEYVPEKPRRYQHAVANAQEAHEAIRPAGDAFRSPDDVAKEISRDELALYDLIWKRTLASQMEDARGQTVSLRLGATSSSGEDVGSRPRGRSSRSADSWPRTSPAVTSRRTTTRSGAFRSWPSATRSPRFRSSPRDTRPRLRRATRSRRWSRPSRTGASGVPRPMPRSSRRSSIAATSSRRERRSSRPSSRSRS